MPATKSLPCVVFSFALWFAFLGDVYLQKQNSYLIIS